MPDKKLTEELLNELLDAPNIDGYIREHDFAAPSLSNYLKQLLQGKGLGALARGSYGSISMRPLAIRSLPVCVIRVAIRCCRLPFAMALTLKRNQPCADGCRSKRP